MSWSRTKPSTSPTCGADVLGDGVRHLADLAHAGGGVDGARLVERLDEAVLAPGADAGLCARERLACVGGAVHGGAHGVREHRHEDGDAEQEAELAGGVEDAGAGAPDAAGHDAHAGGGERRQRQTEAGADERGAPEHLGQGRSARQVPEGEQAGGAQQGAGHGQRARPETVDEAAAERREEEAGRRDDGDSQAGLASPSSPSSRS